jgi:hypothetical protein
MGRWVGGRRDIVEEAVAIALVAALLKGHMLWTVPWSCVWSGVGGSSEHLARANSATMSWHPRGLRNPEVVSSL